MGGKEADEKTMVRDTMISALLLAMDERLEGKEEDALQVAEQMFDVLLGSAHSVDFWVELMTMGTANITKAHKTLAGADDDKMNLFNDAVKALMYQPFRPYTDPELSQDRFLKAMFAFWDLTPNYFRKWDRHFMDQGVEILKQVPVTRGSDRVDNSLAKAVGKAEEKVSKARTELEKIKEKQQGEKQNE